MSCKIYVQFCSILWYLWKFNISCKLHTGIFPCVDVMVRGGVRPREKSKKSILDYIELCQELINQNETPVKMTAAK